MDTNTMLVVKQDSERQQPKDDNKLGQLENQHTGSHMMILEFKPPRVLWPGRPAKPLP
jgi:hypothetical protein